MDGSVATRRAGLLRPGIAERIWRSARDEFSKRGYHGARVQGIARGASCNVALIYRHWSSKRTLYLDVLRTVWIDVTAQLSREQGGEGSLSSFISAIQKDPIGAQILVRECLDGAPHLAQLTKDEPHLLDPINWSSASIHAASLDAIDPILMVIAATGLAALLVSVQESLAKVMASPPTPDELKHRVLELFSRGIARESVGARAEG